MTSYYTKAQDGHIYHFRVTPEANGVDVVEGIYYQWISKYFEGTGSEKAAVARANELIAEHIADGFQPADFKETLENTTDVYDKAKWHYDGNFPAELDKFQGFVHTGLFLGWLINAGLVSDQFKEDHALEINEFMNGELTGPQIFERCCDGVLTLEDLNETGNRFGLHYYDFDNGSFLADYELNLATDLPTLYHVEDTWENYNRLQRVIDQRFSAWKRSGGGNS